MRREVAVDRVEGPLKLDLLVAPCRSIEHSDIAIDGGRGCPERLTRQGWPHAEEKTVTEAVDRFDVIDSSKLVAAFERHWSPKVSATRSDATEHRSPTETRDAR